MSFERTNHRRATNFDGFDPTDGRVTTNNTLDGEMKYQLDGVDVPFEDGFSLAVGKDKTPNTIRSSFTHIDQQKWDRIFRKK